MVLKSRWSTRLLMFGIIMAAIMLMNADPAQASIDSKDGTSSGNTCTSPYGSFQEYINCGVPYDRLSELVPFIRWFGLAPVPVPAISAAAIVGIPGVVATSLSYFIFAVSGFLIMLVGLLVITMAGMPIMENLIHIVDKLTYKTIYGFFGMSDTGGVLPMLGWVLIFLIVSAAIVLLYRRAARIDTRAIVTSLLVLVFLGTMGVQSAKNHSSDSQVGTRNVDQNTPIDSLSSWTPFSLGWNVAAVRKASFVAVGAISSMTGSVGEALASNTLAPDETISASSGDCGIYTKTMMDIYEEQVSGGTWSTKASIVKQYQTMAEVTYFTPLSVAIAGTGPERGSSWCRQLELGNRSPGIEQAYIAFKGGMYDDQVTTIMAADSVPVDTDGDVSTWGPSTASRFFGPKIPSGIGTAAYKFYFAACDSEGKLHDGWNNVTRANGDKWEEDKKTLTNGSCGLLGFTPIEIPTDIVKVTEKQVNQFGYGYADKNLLEQGVDFVAGGLVGYNSDMLKFFLIAPGPGEFYQQTMGFTVGESIVFAIIALISSIFLVRYIGPMAFGAGIVQIIGFLVLAFLPLLLIMAAIPLKATKKFALVGVQTFVASTMVSAIIAGAFGVTFAVHSALAVAFSSTVFGTLPVIRAILAAVAAVLAFKAMNVIIKALTKLDMTNWKDGIKIGMAGGAPVLSSLGMDTSGMDPTKREFWMRKKKDDDTDPTVDTDKNKPIKPGSGDGHLVSGDNKKTKTGQLANGARAAGNLAGHIPHPYAQAASLGLGAGAEAIDKFDKKKNEIKDNAKALFGIGGSQGQNVLADGITGAGSDLVNGIVPGKPTEAQVAERVPNPGNADVEPQSVPGGSSVAVGPDAAQVQEQGQHLASTQPSISGNEMERAALVHNHMPAGAPATVAYQQQQPQQQMLVQPQGQQYRPDMGGAAAVYNEGLILHQREQEIRATREAVNVAQSEEAMRVAMRVVNQPPRPM